MYYAKFISNAQDTPTVGAIDGKPLNFSFAGFESQADRQAAIDSTWQAGGNGFKVTRKEVESFYGRAFELSHFGAVVAQGSEDVLWDDAVAMAESLGDTNAQGYYKALIAQHTPVWAQFI